jgi:RNA polymerase sigma-70 factor (ECF subfamily)
MAGEPQIEEQIAAALARGDARRAATDAIRAFGPQLLGYLNTLLRDEDAAWEVFSSVSERLWRGLSRFRGESSVRTWAYRIAWNEARTYASRAARRRERRFLTGELSRLAEQARTTLRSSSSAEKDGLLARLRAELSAEEQTLLILRIDRGLPWKEVAAVMAEEAELPDPATLRKRYERLRQRILKRVEEEQAQR